jgi:hypothetical protein
MVTVERANTADPGAGVIETIVPWSCRRRRVDDVDPTPRPDRCPAAAGVLIPTTFGRLTETT